MRSTLIIGTRGSDLALWQARFIQKKLLQQGLNVELKIIKTQGDRIQHLSLDKLEGKGFFTKELEEALLNGEIHLAVHSHKDLPTEQPEGLTLAAVTEREDPRECLLIHPDAYDPTRLFGLKEGARIGTSSSRRKVQIMAWRPDVHLEDIRGNVPTRVEKVKNGTVDATLLAQAGINRLALDLSPLHIRTLSERAISPAPAQGVLALQTRADDAELIALLQNIIHQPEVMNLLEGERSLLKLFGGGCHLPLGAMCRRDLDSFVLEVAYSSDQARAPFRLRVRGSNPLNMATEAHRLVAHQAPCRVWISAEENRYSFIRHTLLSQGFTIEGNSLTRVHVTPQRLQDEQPDWIFFNSPGAVGAFVPYLPVSWRGVRIACMGGGTAGALRREGVISDFEGTGSPEEVAEAFGKHAGMCHVYFPASAVGKQTVERILSHTCRVTREVWYKPEIRSELEMPEADVWVFTSASQVKAHQALWPLCLPKAIVWMGPHCREAWQGPLPHLHQQASSPDEVGLLEALYTLNAQRNGYHPTPA